MQQPAEHVLPAPFNAEAATMDIDATLSLSLSLGGLGTLKKLQDKTRFQKARFSRPIYRP